MSSKSNGRRELGASALLLSTLALACAQAGAQTTTAVTKTTAVVTTVVTTPAATTATKPATGVTASVSTSAATTAPTAATTTTKATTTTVVKAAAAPAITWGTYTRPFAANSPWNSRPVNPVFGTAVIPTSTYYPLISGGAYSTGIFLASASDAPVTVYGIGSATGVNDPDVGGAHQVTLPHWPASTLPATGTDGHADIYDPTTGILHSFWQLKQVNGRWQASLYAWSSMTGKGWGNPAHYYQGARATAVPAAAGLIRAHEINDGLPTYQHALAMSLTYNALSKTTPYIYPATSADNDVSTNTGSIPEGALMMLPPTYDTSKIASAALKKVADTLKLYGAYVVDRNTGTPFAIYVENGTGYDLHHGTWDNAVAAELDRIRANLRQVVSASSWVDGDGKVTTMSPAIDDNKLSLRGPWARYSGTGTATFNSWTQAVEFTASPTKTTVTNSATTGMSKVKWATAAVGTTQKLTVTSTGGATLHMQLYSGGTMVADTGALGNGASARVVWPAGAWFVLYATSGVNVPSSVSATLTQVTP